MKKRININWLSVSNFCEIGEHLRAHLFGYGSRTQCPYEPHSRSSESTRSRRRSRTVYAGHTLLTIPSIFPLQPPNPPSSPRRNFACARSITTLSNHHPNAPLARQLPAPEHCSHHARFDPADRLLIAHTFYVISVPPVSAPQTLTPPGRTTSVLPTRHRTARSRHRRFPQQEAPLTVVVRTT